MSGRLSTAEFVGVSKHVHATASPLSCRLVILLNETLLNIPYFIFSVYFKVSFLSSLFLT